MKTDRFRAYERQLVELVGDAGFSGAERLALRDHLNEVMQLRMLSDPAALERDAKPVRQWLEAEWSRLAVQMPLRWHTVKDELRAAIENRKIVAAA